MAEFNKTPVEIVEEAIISSTNMSLLLRDTIRFGAFTSVLYMSGLNALQILFSGLVCFFVNIKLSDRACLKAKEFTTQPTLLTVSAIEKEAFNVGIAAGKSACGYFTAWGTIKTYTHYESYAAGKYLAENDKKSSKIRKL